MTEYLKREKIFEILLMPIECTKYSAGNINIARVGDVIKSTQTYYPYKEWKGKSIPIPLDEDMSDFSIGFYERIYNEILNGNSIINTNNDRLYDSKFAGDTMNSFETIANLFPEAGNCKKNRTSPSLWPMILQEYKFKYHCLANFWVLPIEIGRKIDENNELCKASYTYGIKDYMDRFLRKVKEKDDKIKDFSAKFDSFNEFAITHFLNGSYIYADSTICDFSNDESDGEIMIKKILDRMKLRATAIANSEYVETLWEYFNEWQLI